MDSATKKVIVYGSSYCPYCTKAKDLFQNLGADYAYVSLDGNDTLRSELEKQYSWKTIPMIVINGNFKGGYTDVKKLIDNGTIKQDEICV